MNKGLKIACFFLGVIFLSPGVFSQTIPDTLRRPERGEAPRYPWDLVIGELGRGRAPEDAYRFARTLLEAITAGNRGAPILADSLPALDEALFLEITSLGPRTYRLGGGRTETDGSVSFLVRFLGRTESITGELFILHLQAEDSSSGLWVLDDLILEERRVLSEIRDSYPYDFSPYERFF